MLLNLLWLGSCRICTVQILYVCIFSNKIHQTDTYWFRYNVFFFLTLQRLGPLNFLKSTKKKLIGTNWSSKEKITGTNSRPPKNRPRKKCTQAAFYESYYSPHLSVDYFTSGILYSLCHTRDKYLPSHLIEQISQPLHPLFNFQHEIQTKRTVQF